MSYKTKVFNYGSKLTEYEQGELLSVIKKCIADGYGYEWIWKALQHKDKDEWRKHGYGLFFNKGFRTEISNKLTKTLKEEENSKPLFADMDSLPDDSSCPSPVLSCPSDSERVADGSTLNQLSIQEQDETRDNIKTTKTDTSNVVTDEEILKLIRYDRQYDFCKVTYAGNGIYIAYPTDWTEEEDLTLEELERIQGNNYCIKDLSFKTAKEERDFDIFLRAFAIARWALADKQISIHEPDAIKEKLDMGFKLIHNHQWFNKELGKYWYQLGNPRGGIQDSEQEKSNRAPARSKRPTRCFFELD